MIPALFILVSIIQLFIGYFISDTETDKWGFIILANISAITAIILMEIRK